MVLFSSLSVTLIILINTTFRAVTGEESYISGRGLFHCQYPILRRLSKVGVYLWKYGNLPIIKKRLENVLKHLEIITFIPEDLAVTQ